MYATPNNRIFPTDLESNVTRLTFQTMPHSGQATQAFDSWVEHNKLITLNLSMLARQRGLAPPLGHYVQYKFKTAANWARIGYLITTKYIHLGKHSYSSNGIKIFINNRNYLYLWLNSDRQTFEMWYLYDNSTPDIRQLAKDIDALSVRQQLVIYKK